MSFRSLVLLALVALASTVPPAAKTREEIEAFAKFLEASNDASPLPQLAKAMEAGSGLNADEWSGKFEGDMLLDEDQKAALLEAYASTGHGSRNAVIIPSFRWPGNVIVYEINEAHFTAAQVAAIRRGIADLEAVSCITFRQRTNEFNFVRVTGNTGGCFAHVGYSATRGVHTMNLQPNTVGFGCFTHGTIVHEFLHNLAFLHMHSTYNRDNYLRIAWENMLPGIEHNFAISGSDVVSNLGTSYDFSSCLQYSQFAGSSNGLPTIIPHQPYSGVIGQRIGLSQPDIIKLNRLYSCPGW